MRRFPVARERDPLDFGRRSREVFERTHSLADELAWLDSEGPTSPALIEHIAPVGERLRLLPLLQLPLLPRVSRRPRACPTRRSSCRPPNATRRSGSSIFGPIFRGVRAVMYNSPEERAMIQAASGNAHVPGVVVGVGSAVPERTDPAALPAEVRHATARSRSTSAASTQNKGCGELFDYFQRYARAFPRGLDLVLIGKPVIPIPAHPRIRHLGFVSDQDKFDALAAADLLIMPSYFESLSMVALEAWALGRPVLANGRCDVLQGPVHPQQRRASTTRATRSSSRRCTRSSRTARCTRASARNGRDFFERHYAWPVIERKYLDMLAAAATRSRRRGADRAAARLVRAAPPRLRRRAGRCSAACRREPATRSGPGGQVAHDARTTARRASIRCSPRSATATPSATRCSASSACCAAPATSRRSSSRPPTRGSKTLTLDYRDLIDDVAPHDVLIHHFSIGSRASRIAYALPGRMVLVYHNITPPEYFIGVHKELVKLCFRGRRELTAYIDRVRSRARRLRVQPRGARSARLPATPASCRSCLTSSTSTCRPTRRLAPTSTTAGRTCCSSAGSSRTRRSRTSSAPSTPTARATTRASRLLLVGSYSGFERYLAMLQELIATLGTPDVHFLGHVSNEELTALYDVADLFLCASEHEGFCVPIIEAFYKRRAGARLRRRPRCRRRWTAAACCTRRRIRSRLPG